MTAVEGDEALPVAFGGWFVVAPTLREGEAVMHAGIHFQRARIAGFPEQVLKFLASTNPHNRIGSPEEIADSVAFLSSADSRWVTGQVLRVNGGMA